MTKRKGMAFAITTVFLSLAFLFSDLNPLFDDEGFKSLNAELGNHYPEFDALLATAYDLRKVDGGRDCPCEHALYYVYCFRKGRLSTKAIYKIKMDMKYSHSQCLEFELKHADFTNGNVGASQASQCYFSKNLMQLSERERLAMLVMLENPALYNPIRRKAKVMGKADFYLKLINESR